MDNATTPLKRCTKCGNEYPATTEFFRKVKGYRYGVHSQCWACERACQREYMRQKRQTPESKAYEYEYNRRPEVVARKKKHLQAWRGSDAYKEYIQGYQSRPETRALAREAMRRIRQTPHGKLIGKAHSKVHNAIRSGQLPPVTKMACAECGGQAEEYHHWSYEQEHWLDVIPLCTKCHVKLHREITE